MYIHVYKAIYQHMNILMVLLLVATHFASQSVKIELLLITWENDKKY